VGEADNETPAAAAERQRLTASGDGLSLQTIVVWLDTMLPYALLLLLLLGATHGRALLQLAWLLSCAAKAQRGVHSAWLALEQQACAIQVSII
jgi:hypothetical protein